MQSALGNHSVQDLKLLIIANVLHSGFSSMIDNETALYNEQFVATDVVLGIANGVFIAKAISAAASPWMTGLILVPGIARSICSIIYRKSPTKTTATITNNPSSVNN